MVDWVDCSQLSCFPSGWSSQNLLWFWELPIYESCFALFCSLLEWTSKSNCSKDFPFNRCVQWLTSSKRPGHLHLVCKGPELSKCCVTLTAVFPWRRVSSFLSYHHPVNIPCTETLRKSWYSVFNLCGAGIPGMSLFLFIIHLLAHSWIQITMLRMWGTWVLDNGKGLGGRGESGNLVSELFCFPSHLTLEDGVCSLATASVSSGKQKWQLFYLYQRLFPGGIYIKQSDRCSILKDWVFFFATIWPVFSVPLPA